MGCLCVQFCSLQRTPLGLSMKTIEPVKLFASSPGKTHWQITALRRSKRRVLKKEEENGWPALVWGQGLVPQPSSPVREEFPPSQASTLSYTIQSAKITPLPEEPSSHLKAPRAKGSIDALREHPDEGGNKIKWEGQSQMGDFPGRMRAACNGIDSQFLRSSWADLYYRQSPSLGISSPSLSFRPLQVNSKFPFQFSLLSLLDPTGPSLIIRACGIPTHHWSWPDQVSHTYLLVTIVVEICVL